MRDPFMSTRLLSSILAYGVAASSAWAGDLFVGFGADAALQMGDSVTLSTSDGPSVGTVSAIASTTDWEVFVAADGFIRRLSSDGSSVAATLIPPHDVVALAGGSGVLYVASVAGTVTEIDAITGGFLRSSSIGQPIRAMIEDGARLYVATGTGQIWSASTANLVWKLETANAPLGINSIVARGSTLLVGTDGHVFVFERDSGALIYGYNVPNDAAAIGLEGNFVVVGGDDGSLYRVDPGTGAIAVANSFNDATGALPITALSITQAAPFAALKAQVTWVALSQPAPQAFRLEVGDSVGDLSYLMLGSVTGTKPGIMLGGKPVPLNLDPYLMWCFAGNPLLLGGMGTFSDANAFQVHMADAWFVAPSGMPPSVANITMAHAFVVFDSATGGVRAVSNPKGTTFIP